MKRMSAWALCAGLILGACGPEADGRAAADIDLTPPVLLAAACTAPGSAEMRFSEPVTLVAGSFASDPPLSLSRAQPEGDCLLLDTGVQTPGAPYLVELTVADARGNTAAIVVPLYGFNADVPSLLINELTVRGSSTHPDIVELRLESAGDMGGVVLCNGTAGSWTDRIVFPAFRVEAGDFVLAHFKPEGLPEEVDETTSKTLSGGLDASATAYDFWVRGASGLNGNNGVLSVYSRIGGGVLDAILYSNRTSASDTEYAGFGSAETMARAFEIAEAGGWSAEGEAVRPEDGVNPGAVHEHAIHLPQAWNRHRHASGLVHRADARGHLRRREQAGGVCALRQAAALPGRSPVRLDPGAPASSPGRVASGCRRPRASGPTPSWIGRGPPRPDTPRRVGNRPRKVRPLPIRSP